MVREEDHRRYYKRRRKEEHPMAYEHPGLRYLAHVRELWWQRQEVTREPRM